MSGVFHSTRFCFLVGEEPEQLALPDALEICEEELDIRLFETGRIPPLGAAPVASWVLARLAALTKGDVGLNDNAVQHNDGGSWVLEILVYRLDRTVVAGLQLQGGRDGVAVFGSCVPSERPEEIVSELTTVLLQAAEEIRPIRIRVRDPEDGSRRSYGWNGSKYLGG